MRLLPKDKLGRVTFCQTHLAAWAERAEEIGTTPEEVAELSALTEAAREALEVQERCRIAAETATLNAKQRVAAMSRLAAAILLQVRARARTEGRGTYVKAMIEAPASPSPIDAPGTPNRFAAELGPSGQIMLRWRCKNPRGSQGTMYEVRRTVDGGSEEYLGHVGKKTFVDETLPAGSKQVLYSVRAVRSTRVGQAATHNVNLGVGPGGISKPKFFTSDGNLAAA